MKYKKIIEEIKRKKDDYISKEELKKIFVKIYRAF